MLQKQKQWAHFLPFLLFAAVALGQSPEAAKFYKLDFAVKEVEGGKLLSARNYSMIVSSASSASPGSIRTGSKVPTETASITGNKQFNYVEVGTNIDCRSLQETSGDLSMFLVAELTTALQETAGGSPPVLRQNKWMSNVIVPMRKPTVVFSADDGNTKRQMQLELTASPIR